MTEILTESFCERCGTRYTFESARPKARLQGVKVLSRGLKNFVLSDSTSIDEAMASARSEADRDSTAHQLDAFHKTFSFCMSCRQYACANCWNEPEAKCLSCAPLAIVPLAVPVEPARFDDLSALRAAALFGEAGHGNGNGAAEHHHDGELGHPWIGTGADPEIELIGLGETAAIEPAPEIELIGLGETAAMEPAPEIELIGLGETAAILAAEPDLAPAGAPPVPSDTHGKAAAQTRSLLRRFRPGQSLDAELAAFERQRGGGSSDAEQMASIAPEAPPPAATIAPETQVEVSAPPPEALRAAVPIESEGTSPQRTDPIDVIPQPTWRITAPDAISPSPFPAPKGPGPGSPSPTVPTGSVGGEPQWPATPQWPVAASAAPPAAGLPFLGRPATPQGGIDALWAASNQELSTARPAAGKSATSVQPCVSCGLSLSSTARFCRRCGTSQGV
jgi:ribosomal protein L40E